MLEKRLSGRVRRGLRVIATITAVAPLAITAGCDPDPWKGCYIGQFCVYENRGFGGHIKRWSGSDSDYRNNKWYMGSDFMDNEVSAYVNRSDCTIHLFQDVGHEGQVSHIAPGYVQDSLEGDPNGDVGDNEASSHSFQCQ